jgi:hypothetical protein
LAVYAYPSAAQDRGANGGGSLSFAGYSARAHERGAVGSLVVNLVVEAYPSFAWERGTEGRAIGAQVANTPASRTGYVTLSITGRTAPTVKLEITGRTNVATTLLLNRRTTSITKLD